MIYLIITGVLFVLTHHYESIVGQTARGKYHKDDNQLTAIPTDIPSYVVEVEISSEQITTIKANVFLQLSQCRHLHLGSSISEIEPGTFNGLTSLTSLSLGNNKLKQLSVNMFSGISSCNRLYLEHNKIREIEPGSFDGLVNLEYLSLSSNHLTALRTDMFRGLSKCTEIELYRNRISEVEAGSFNGLISLRALQFMPTG